mmetsp:Transcript_8022/g.24696  ORF Transcript_8022/g.24696 Transcript_8022/m.24696 type:complete len:205 (+) Transcript_8022:1771-2385(+)
MSDQEPDVDVVPLQEGCGDRDEWRVVADAVDGVEELVKRLAVVGRAEDGASVPAAIEGARRVEGNVDVLETDERARRGGGEGFGEREFAEPLEREMTQRQTEVRRDGQNATGLARAGRAVQQVAAPMRQGALAIPRLVVDERLNVGDEVVEEPVREHDAFHRTFSHQRRQLPALLLRRQLVHLDVLPVFRLRLAKRLSEPQRDL